MYSYRVINIYYIYFNLTNFVSFIHGCPLLIEVFTLHYWTIYVSKYNVNSEIISKYFCNVLLENVRSIFVPCDDVKCDVEQKIRPPIDDIAFASRDTFHSFLHSWMHKGRNSLTISHAMSRTSTIHGCRRICIPPACQGYFRLFSTVRVYIRPWIEHANIAKLH